MIEEIVGVLWNAYKKINKKSLTVYSIQAWDLKDYFTSKEDYWQGYVKRPCDEDMVSSEEFKSFSAYDEGYETESLVRKRNGSTIYSSEGDKVCKYDFEVWKILGIGSFGKVYLVWRRGTDKYYAMKEQKKISILENDSLESTKLEKKIMQVANHPFIVKMRFVFMTEDKLYFVMDFVRGGELY